MTCGQSWGFSLVSLRRLNAALDAALKKQRGHALPQGHGKALRPRSGLDLDGGASIAPAVRAREITSTTLIDGPV